jgi:hypothetical protein
MIYTGPRPLLLADQAQTAIQPGACQLCPRQLHIGQRIARLLDGSGWAHVGCVAVMVPDRQ